MINFGILGQGVDPGNAFLQGFQNGRALRQQQMTDNALAQYAQNPEDPQALQALTVANPQLGLGLRREQRIEQYQGQQLALQQQQAQARAQAEQMEEARKVVGQAALGILRVPEAQRGQAWDQQIDLLAQRFPGFAQYKGRYSPQLLDAALAEAGLMDKAIDLTSPRYQAIVPGGQLQNTNPYAVGSDMGAQPANVPQPGTVEDGYIFRGGNPADPNSWEPVGGAGSGPRNFP